MGAAEGQKRSWVKLSGVKLSEVEVSLGCERGCGGLPGRFAPRPGEEVRGDQEPPRLAQDPKTAQQLPKTAQDTPKRLPKGPKSHNTY